MDEMPAVPSVEHPSSEVADVDIFIERADLGSDTYTLVAAGDPIPTRLVSLPRRPARDAIALPPPAPVTRKSRARGGKSGEEA